MSLLTHDLLPHAAGGSGAAPGATARTQALRAAAQRFVDRHPGCLAVSLGAGPAQPVAGPGRGGPRWIDIDPLRRQPGVLAGLAAAGGWQRLGLPSGRHQPPLLVWAEDVVNRLDPATFLRLLWNVGHHAPPGSRLLLDALAWPLARRRHPAGFGLRRVAELAAAHPRLRLDEVHHTLHPLLAPLLHVWFGAPGAAVYELGVDA